MEQYGVEIWYMSVFASLCSLLLFYWLQLVFDSHPRAYAADRKWIIWLALSYNSFLLTEILGRDRPNGNSSKLSRDVSCSVALAIITGCNLMQTLGCRAVNNLKTSPSCPTVFRFSPVICLLSAKYRLPLQVYFAQAYLYAPYTCSLSTWLLFYNATSPKELFKGVCSGQARKLFLNPLSFALMYFL